MSVACCRNEDVNLAAWAERNGVARVTAYRWFHAGLLPVPVQRVGRLILVDEPIGDVAYSRALRCMRGCAQRSRKQMWIGRWRG